MEITTLPGLKEHVPLAPFTTFRIGGPARWFVEAKTSEELRDAVVEARAQGVPFFVLAGGSNIVVKDGGFDGLVILASNDGWSIEGTRLEAEAGVRVSTLVKETGGRGLSGLEWAGGLPGSLGGAVRGNAGAFGGEIKDAVETVRALSPTGGVQTLLARDCGFSYRDSRFQQENWVILSSSFLLNKGRREDIQKTARDNIAYRKERHPLEFPNAGSMFKNCDAGVLPREVAERFADKIKVDPFPVLPAAVLIAEAGLAGMRAGGAEVSEKHTNYIVNRGGATAQDVRELASRVKERVAEAFGVELIEEIQFV